MIRRILTWCSLFAGSNVDDGRAENIRAFKDSSINLMLMFSAALSFLSGSQAFAKPGHDELWPAFRDRYYYGFHFDENLRVFTEDNVTGKIVLAIWDLEHLSLQSSDPSIQPPNYYQYFSDVVQRISYSEEGLCGEGFAAFASQSVYGKSGGSITFCPSFFSQSRESMLMTLIHEAAHLYVGKPSHVTCEAGPLQGGHDSCDEVFYDRFSAGGAYGVQILAAVWIIASAVNSDLDISEFRRTARYFFERNFNSYQTSRGLVRSRDIYGGKFTIDGQAVGPKEAFDWIVDDKVSWLKE